MRQPGGVNLRSAVRMAGFPEAEPPDGAGLQSRFPVPTHFPTRGPRFQRNSLPLPLERSHHSRRRMRSLPPGPVNNFHWNPELGGVYSSREVTPTEFRLSLARISSRLPQPTSLDPGWAWLLGAIGEVQIRSRRVRPWREVLQRRIGRSPDRPWPNPFSRPPCAPRPSVAP